MQPLVSPNFCLINFWKSAQLQILNLYKKSLHLQIKKNINSIHAAFVSSIPGLLLNIKEQQIEGSLLTTMDMISAHLKSIIYFERCFSIGCFFPSNKTAALVIRSLKTGLVKNSVHIFFCLDAIPYITSALVAAQIK